MNIFKNNEMRRSNVMETSASSYWLFRCFKTSLYGLDLSFSILAKKNFFWTKIKDKQ